MTAKHRKGKGNHKHEDNFFKNDFAECEARAGPNNYALHLVLFLMIVIGGATGAWFSFQQHQTLTHLTENLMGMQMKMVKLQSSHEEMRQSSNKHFSESLETRLNALEESYSLAQKQVGMALATAEQLRTSDLPAQVLSLHTEMKARLAETQQATVSLEQLSQLQSMLKGKSEEFEGVRIQVNGLDSLSAELSQKVEALTGSLGEAQLKLEERGGQVSTLSAALDGQAGELLRLKEQMDTCQTQLEASTQEIASVRESLQSEQSQQHWQADVEEQLVELRQSLQDHTSAARSLTSGLEAQLENIQTQVTQLGGRTQPPAEPEDQTEEEVTSAATAAEGAEEEALLAEEASSPDEGGEAAAQDEAPVEEVDSVMDEAAPAEEVEIVEEDQTEQQESDAASVNEEVEVTERAEGVSEEVQEEQMLEEEVTGGDGEPKEESPGEEEPPEEVWEEEALEEEQPYVEEEASEGDEEQQDVTAEEEADDGEEPLEYNALTEDECK